MKTAGRFCGMFILVLFCSFFRVLDAEAADAVYTSAEGTVYTYGNFYPYSTRINVPLSDANLYKTTSYGRYYTYAYDFVDSFTIPIFASGDFFNDFRPSNVYIGFGLSPTFVGSVNASVECTLSVGSSTFDVSPSGGWFNVPSDLPFFSVVYLKFVIRGTYDMNFSVSSYNTDPFYSVYFSRNYNFSLSDVQVCLASSYLSRTVAAINDNVLKLLNDQGVTGAINNQTNVIRDGINQAHQDMDKVNGSLTSFEGSASMDASRGRLDSVIGDYGSVEGSLFDSGRTAIDLFDIGGTLTFSLGISSAIDVISSLAVGIISSMGGFSVLYTVGMSLVFCGILVGLWRFFK